MDRIKKLLYCIVILYPTPLSDANILTINELRNFLRFQLIL